MSKSAAIDPSLPPQFQAASAKLREALAAAKKRDIWPNTVEARDEVFARFRPLLARDHIPILTEEEIRPFFYIENNRHWSSLYRQVNRICGDMPKFRQALLTLTDESRPIDERLNKAGESIKGLGKAIMTAILIVAFPEKYGVWNDASEMAMTALGVFPPKTRGASLGGRYIEVNRLLNAFAEELDVDLWTLDVLWWVVLDESPADDISADGNAPSSHEAPSGQYFGLERHLHDFLFDNWDRTDLGREWAIYAERGAPDAGYEYVCDVGKIDILARHRTEKRWLVVELKRNKTSDQTVGQVLRYIGWVQENLADAGEAVTGLIIARDGDLGLHYAVRAAPFVKFMSYEVEFRLTPAADANRKARG